MNAQRPELEAPNKLVALRAAARSLGVPPEDLLFLGIVLMQTSESSKSQMSFTDVCAQMIGDIPPHIQFATKELIKSLKRVNDQVTEERLSSLIEDIKKDAQETVILIVGNRSSGDG